MQEFNNLKGIPGKIIWSNVNVKMNSNEPIVIAQKVHITRDR